MDQGLDRWVGYIDIVAGANAYVFRENSSNYTRTFPPGRYWLYDSNTDIPGYPAFYRILREQMTAVAVGGNVYAIEAANPLGANQALYGGLRYIRSSGSLDWGFSFTAGAWTLPNWPFGFPESASNFYGSAPTVATPLGIPRIWVSPVAHSQAIAYPIRRNVASTEDVWLPGAYQVNWLEASVRIYQYRYVLAAFVHSERAHEPCFTSAADTLPGDTSPAFDNIWTECLSRMGTVLILRGQGGSEPSLRLTNYPASQREAARALVPNQRQALENIARLQIMGGERYTLEMAMVTV